MFQYGFCDLKVNVDDVDKEAVVSVCRLLRQKGFRTIALNQLITEDDFILKKKKGKSSVDSGHLVPTPLNIGHVEGIEDLKIFNRLTAQLTDPSQLYQLRQSSNFNKYHIFAVIPMNSNMLQQVCNTNDVDVISFLPESKPPCRLSRKLYRKAVEMSIYLELPYGPAIIDTTCRNNVITTAHQYFTLGKSKNVIISSDGSYPYYSIRGPYDIIHLGLVLGLDDVQTKEAITKNCAELIYRAETRRRRKSFVSSMKLVAPDDHKSSNEIENDDESHPDRPLKRIKL